MLCACNVALCYAMLCSVMWLLVDLALRRIRCQGQPAASPTRGTVIACRIGAGQWAGGMPHLPTIQKFRPLPKSAREFIFGIYRFCAQPEQIILYVLI